VTTIHTIGHSRHSGERFVSLLGEHGIVRLVDVRSHPASRWSPQFGKAALAKLLAAHAIEYVFLGRELGGRPEGAEFYRVDGTVDYARRAEAPEFEAGIRRLVGLAHERATAIMCAEEDPARCHRRLLVAPSLRRVGLCVVHIRGDGCIEPDPGGSRQIDLFR
jgi:uncharacterized protein (DUF488 family)